MALFRRKPTNDDAAPASAAFEPQPEKARKWFDFGRTAADSFNYEYALQCYASGLKLDPDARSAHEAMFEVGVKYLSQGGKPASGKEIKSFEDGTPVGKFVAAEFEWVKSLKNLKLALRALDAAVKAERLEVGHWFVPRIMSLVRAEKKPSKNLLVQAMELFRSVHAWDASLTVGEMARELDPSDNELAADLKNLAADRAMDVGGYTRNIGQEGSFRGSIRDADKQQQLIEEESLSGGASAEERVFARAQAAYEENPGLPDNIARFAQLLKKQGDLESVERAHGVYMDGFGRTGEYRFRMSAGDIRIEQAEAAYHAARDRARAAADDPGARAEAERTRKTLLDLQMAEYSERVERYPTDRVRKMQLGEVQYALGEYQEAMVQFQAAMDEPKLQARAGHRLGLCFLAEGWFSDAIPVFQEAIRTVDQSDRDAEMALKYDLLLALLGAAQQERSLDHARDAKTLCSEIMRKNIAYRDIRQKRTEVDALIAELGG